MQTVSQRTPDVQLLDWLKLPEEKFPSICCAECKNSVWNAEKKLYLCLYCGILVEGEDTCDEAEAEVKNFDT